MTFDAPSAPLDTRSAETLAERGLRLGLVDTSDASAFDTWLESDSRGFHGGVPSPESLAAQRAGLAYRRTTGVWDETAAESHAPVSTVSSWVSDLTVPGGSVDGWAISAVTVAPTHRRKGIARAMLESELRTASAAGIPLAMLTVSEATIYGRYGFAPAAMSAKWSVDPRRGSWTGPEATGRIHFLSREAARDQLGEIIARAREENPVPGDIERWEYLTTRTLGFDEPSGDRAKKARIVRYDDAEGTAQGFAVFSLAETDENNFLHTVTVHDLVTVTDDAYAGLWRFLLEMDLVQEVTADLRAVDEPLAWLLSDFRATRLADQRDFLWLRILDVVATLEARRYSAPGRLVLDTADPLGFADALVLLEVAADGTATVTPLDGEAPDDAAAVSLTVGELGSIYLGGVTARSLARAGRIEELRPGSVDRLDAMFRWSDAPRLSVWF
ncbi:GNAT family N-acetyltransferase [Marisediminicola sp. LYQ134]|uniref:GNAT family N-acetyltransferase n=1 Tax=Marisediminicola sp. LYQ134 TaxID=3391061 RepID=UPI0039831E85